MRAGRLDQPGQAEVENLRAAVGGDEDVRGRHVAVNDAFLVRGRQPMSDLNGEIDGGLLRQRAIQQRVAQRLAVEQLRHHERQLAFDAHIEDRDNVGVIERGGGLRFVLEAVETIGVQRELGGSTLIATSRPSRASGLGRPRPSRRRPAVRRFRTGRDERLR